MICITRTGLIVKRNREHIKATAITAEQYLSDKLSKHSVDILDNILKNFEEETQSNLTHPHNRQIEEDTHE